MPCDAGVGGGERDSFAAGEGRGTRCCLCIRQTACPTCLSLREVQVVTALEEHLKSLAPQVTVLSTVWPSGHNSAQFGTGRL